MTRIVRRAGRLTALTALSLAVAVNSDASAQAPEVRLTISTARDSYIAGEPVEVRFRLENVSGRRITDDLYLSFRFDRLSVLAGPDGTGLAPHVSTAMQIARAKKLVGSQVTLAPGEAIESQELLSYDASSGLSFKAPGAYRVKASFTYHHYERTVLSNELVFTMTQPFARDAEALAFLLANKIEWSLTPERDLFPESLEQQKIDKIREFKSLYGDTTYAAYVEEPSEQPPDQPGPLDFIRKILRDAGVPDPFLPPPDQVPAGSSSKLGGWQGLLLTVLTLLLAALVSLPVRRRSPQVERGGGEQSRKR